MIFEYKTINFEDKEKFVRFNFLKIFYFDVNKDELSRLGRFKIFKNKIAFEEDVENRFNQILSNGFQNLKNKITKKPTVYVHRNSGIPLIGNISFGIIDRNSSVIEIKPITGCNLDCIYCSVAQEKRETDFVVEREYLIQELKKLIEFKDMDDLEVHIGCQGEPLLYAELVDLIKDIKEIKNVKTISMDTNAVLLTKEKADELVKNGLNQFNISINAVDEDKAKNISGCEFYNVKKAKDIIKHISKKADLIIAPVWIKGFNDDEIPKLIEFAKSLNARIGVQNYLRYRFGKLIAKSIPWKKFYNKLKEYEEKYDIQLIFSEKDFNIRKSKVLVKPFKKGNIIEAEIKCKARLPNSMIAVSDDRNITVSDCDKPVGSRVKIRILKAKHNIFYAKLV